MALVGEPTLGAQFPRRRHAADRLGLETPLAHAPEGRDLGIDRLFPRSRALPWR